jgi:hypothetical protein
MNEQTQLHVQTNLAAAWPTSGLSASDRDSDNALHPIIQHHVRATIGRIFRLESPPIGCLSQRRWRLKNPKIGQCGLEDSLRTSLIGAEWDWEAVTIGLTYDAQMPMMIFAVAVGRKSCVLVHVHVQVQLRRRLGEVKNGTLKISYSQFYRPPKSGLFVRDRRSPSSVGQSIRLMRQNARHTSLLCNAAATKCTLRVPTGVDEIADWRCSDVINDWSEFLYIMR